MGGGTGLSATLAGLKQFTDPPRATSEDSFFFADLSALVTVSDDGGSSGRLRDEFEMLAPGDIRACLVALSSDESLMSSLFQYRFGGSGELSGHSFGNIFLTALKEVTGDFYEAVRAASQVLAIDGRIFPSTNQSVSLIAELKDGTTVEGETNISSSTAPIHRVKLVPADCRPPTDALQAIEHADIIVLGPGSLYTSILPNLLVPGVVEAVNRCRGIKVYLCNAMTQPGETSGFGVSDHITALMEHCPDLELSFVLANNTPVPEHIRERYEGEGASVVAPESGGSLPCPLVLEDLLQKGPVVRHDGRKTALALQSLFARERVDSRAS